MLGFNKSTKKCKFLPSMKPFFTTITLYHKLSVIVRLSAKTKQSIRHFSLFPFATVPDLNFKDFTTRKSQVATRNKFHYFSNSKIPVTIAAIELLQPGV